MASPRSVTTTAKYKSASAGLAIVYEPPFTLDVLFIDRNRVVGQCLFRFLTLDAMGTKFAQVVPIPIEHRLPLLYMQCIPCRAMKNPTLV